MLLLTDEQIQNLLPLPPLIEALSQAFRDDYAKFRAPVRTRFEQGNRLVLLMPCQANGVIGFKTILLENRPGKGPDIYSSTYTYHSLDGEITALMDAKFLTEQRTAATSAVATQVLAPETVHTLGIFGTGVIAKAHVVALREVRNFERLLVCSSTPEKGREFAQWATQRHGISATAVDADTCAAESSVICTCTTSSVPLFRGSVLRPGTHINAVGAFSAGTRELDTETIVRSRVVVDTIPGALAEAPSRAMDRIFTEIHVTTRFGRTERPNNANMRPSPLASRNERPGGTAIVLIDHKIVDGDVCGGRLALVSLPRGH